MTVALGASGYSIAIFHLMTHAFFKALLFLAAGSVIMAMHHDQDIRNMGGLRKYLPITWLTSLIGTLALIGTPFFSGFYSKDSIIEIVELSKLPGAGFAYFAVTAGVFITAFYSFRMYFLVFHGEERFGKAHHHDHHHDAEAHHGLAVGQKPHESPWVVTLPLILLAIPSVGIGYVAIEPMVFGAYFKDAIYIGQSHSGITALAEEFHGPLLKALHAFSEPPLWLALGGVITAWVFYLKRPDLPAAIHKRFQSVYTLLDNKYYFDRFNDWFFAAGARNVSSFLWKFGDIKLIDGVVVNGSAKAVGWFSRIIRQLQSGYIYHYAFSMIIGVFVLMTIRTWF
jgi:NADH-quinone oxidoreductase subunit L